MNEDINSPTCTNEKLIQQYAQFGYQFERRGTKLPTQM